MKKKKKNKKKRKKTLKKNPNKKQQLLLENVKRVFDVASFKGLWVVFSDKVRKLVVYSWSVMHDVSLLCISRGKKTN